MSEGMTGIWPASQGVIADPNTSAWRVTQPYQTVGAFSGNAVGTGQVLDARGNGAGLMTYAISGNSVSADIVVSPDSATWLSLTAFAGTAGSTGTGAWNGYYPWIAVRALWISGGSRTGLLQVNLSLI